MLVLELNLGLIILVLELKYLAYLKIILFCLCELHGSSLFFFHFCIIHNIFQMLNSRDVSLRGNVDN